MTLSEQVEYINKIKDRVLEYEEYEFVTRNQFYYVLFDLRTKLPLLEIRYGWKDFELQVFDFFDYNTTKPHISCRLEDFLSNYFGDMINPTPEEKVMWKLQFGFDWFF